MEYVYLGDEVSDGIFAWISVGINPTKDSSVTPAAYTLSRAVLRTRALVAWAVAVMVTDALPLVPPLPAFSLERDCVCFALNYIMLGGYGYNSVVPEKT